MNNLLERFFKYISFETTSDEDSPETPSNPKEFELAKYLKEELETIGLSDIILTDNCYLYAMLPASRGMEDKSAIGFISHMDTSPDASGHDVKPQIIEDYQGNDIILKGSGETLSMIDFPDLKYAIHKTLITTDGTTLLGADDKAGIAEIMTALDEIVSKKIPHGKIYIGFTPDEEIGNGASLFDLSIFKAEYAYTVDGDYEGEVAYENFNAASAEFFIKGVSVHPGEAKDIMVNAGLIATEIASSLPPEKTPANTSGRQGFFHLTGLRGDVAKAQLNYIIRDHDQKKFKEKLQDLKDLEQEFNYKYGEGTVTLTITQSYKNMFPIITNHMEIIDRAYAAIRACGLNPISRPVRGGTDGAMLSYMGLPCPNLGTGGYGYHGPFEHITLEGMESMVEIIKTLMSWTE
ncbi:MAG: peptidase T [Lachnospiraceae bacterium]|nr:peptidase T [Lachnospiraceae bacterium]